MTEEMDVRCVSSNGRSDSASTREHEECLHALRRRLRCKFAQSLESTLGAVQTPQQVVSSGSGAFEYMSVDVLSHLLQLLSQPDEESNEGEKGLEFIRDIERASSCVLSFSTTCKFVNSTLRFASPWLRLELHARICTQLVPNRVQSCNYPFVDQYIREMKTRIDVKMLERALRGMVCHCASAQGCPFNCVHARNQHNLIYGASNAKQSTLWNFALKNTTPRVKPICGSAGGIAAVSETNACIVLSVVRDRDACMHARTMPFTTHAARAMLKDRNTYKLSCYIDEPPAIWTPGVESSLVSTVVLPKLQLRSEDEISMRTEMDRTPRPSSCGRFACIMEHSFGQNDMHSFPSDVDTIFLRNTAKARGWLARVHVWTIGNIGFGNEKTKDRIQTIQVPHTLDVEPQPRPRRGPEDEIGPCDDVMCPRRAWFYSRSSASAPDLVIHWVRIPRAGSSMLDRAVNELDNYRSQIVAYKLYPDGEFKVDRMVWHGCSYPIAWDATPSGHMVAITTELHICDGGRQRYRDVEVVDLERGKMCNTHTKAISFSVDDIFVPRINASGDTIALMIVSIPTRSVIKLYLYTRMSAISYRPIRTEQIYRLNPTPRVVNENVSQIVFRERFPISCFSPCGRFLMLSNAGLEPVCTRNVGDLHTNAQQHQTQRQSQAEALLVIDLSERHNGLLGSLCWLISIREQMPLSVDWNDSGLWLRTRYGVLLIGSRTPRA